MDNGLVITGVGSLTSALVNAIRAGTLANLGEADVVPYLTKNLH